MQLLRNKLSRDICARNTNIVSLFPNWTICFWSLTFRPRMSPNQRRDDYLVDGMHNKRTNFHSKCPIRFEKCAKSDSWRRALAVIFRKKKKKTKWHFHFSSACLDRRKLTIRLLSSGNRSSRKVLANHSLMSGKKK